MKFLNKHKLSERTVRRFKYSIGVFALLAGSLYLKQVYMGDELD